MDTNLPDKEIIKIYPGADKSGWIRILHDRMVDIFGEDSLKDLAVAETNSYALGVCFYFVVIAER